MGQQTKLVYRFGSFQLDAGERSLLHAGKPVPLAPKVFDTLLILVENHGRLVEKADFMRRLWPDTFVEEVTLAGNISDLRKALDEASNGQKLIETVPKFGYRFVGHVETVRPDPPPAAPASGRLLKVLRRRIGLGAAISAVGVITASAVWVRGRLPLLAAAQITFDEDAYNTEPALSPDRKWIAFASDRAGDGNMDLWIVPASGGTPRRLTFGEINARQPDFSPDSKLIVYRSDRDGGGLFRVAADGSTSPARISLSGFRPRFSPDGKRIVYWDGVDTSSDLSVAGGSRAYITSLTGGTPRGICPDFAAAAFPIWSSDGTRVLFLGRHSPAGEFGRDASFWVTPVNECNPTPVMATQAELPDYYRGTSKIPQRWIQDGDSSLIYNSDERFGLTQFLFSSNGRVIGPARELPFPLSSSDRLPAYVLDAHTLVFSDSARNADLWSITIDSVGHPGEPRLAVRCGGEVCLPAVSQDGSVLFYSRVVKNNVEFIRHDFRSGTDESVAAQDYAPIYPFVIGPQAVPVYAKTVGLTHVLQAYHSRSVNAVCSGCILFWDVSSSGRYALAMTGSDLRRIDLFDTQSEASTPVLSHNRWNLYWAAFSPNEKEIVFCAKVTPGRCQLFVAGFNDGRADPASNWIPVSSASEYNGPAHWSPDGSRIYFASDRDGHRCLYVREWDRKRRQPAGPIVPVQHFHASSPSAGLIDQPQFGFAVAQDKIIIEMGSRKGNIWLVR